MGKERQERQETTEENKENNENKQKGLDRRQFFVKAGATALATTGACLGVFGVGYLSPSVLYEPSPIVNVGKPDSYPVDSVTLESKLGVFIVRLAEGFYAMSAVCSHLGCLSAWKPEAGIIACPCHGSAFHRDGAVIAGPAPRPLPWLRMWLSDEGNLMIDRATIIAAQSEYVRT